MRAGIYRFVLCVVLATVVSGCDSITGGGDIKLTMVSGDGQTIAPGATSAPLVVKLTTGNDAVIGGAIVSWVASGVAGTLAPDFTVTGAGGLAQVTFKAGTVTGNASVKATVSSKAVTFNLIVKTPTP